MRLLGILLIVFGAIVLAYGGITYTKSRHSTDIGPVQVSTATHGFVTPAAGVIAVVAGIVLVAAGRRNMI
jgi:TRAP-type C4-dicarboxylate transport system permease small subunit